jgi:hypothetical protein
LHEKPSASCSSASFAHVFGQPQFTSVSTGIGTDLLWIEVDGSTKSYGTDGAALEAMYHSVLLSE